MGHPNQVTELLNALVQGLKQVLAIDLVGVYLRGSLACGGFDPDTSDVDVLVITERPVDDPTFARLSVLHEQIALLPNPYAQQIEIAYWDREAARTYRPGQNHPTLERGAGERLKWQEHGQNWILERWTVREMGKVLYGPDPRTLIDEITPDEMVRAVRTRLQDWAEWARDVDDPDWLLPKAHKAYVVETMCRALYTLETGRLAGKPQSVQWALEHVPPDWRELVARSRDWRTDNTVDLSINPAVRDFVLWVASFDRCTG